MTQFIHTLYTLYSFYLIKLMLPIGEIFNIFVVVKP